MTEDDAPVGGKAAGMMAALDPAVIGRGGPLVIGMVDEADLLFADKRSADKQWPLGKLGETLRASMPIRAATLDAFGKLGEALRGMMSVQVLFREAALRAARNPRRAARRSSHRRLVPLTPAVAAEGLTRVAASQARAARSALLRSQRRALKYNRALPPRRPAQIPARTFHVTGVAEHLASGSVHVQPG